MAFETETFCKIKNVLYIYIYIYIYIYLFLQNIFNKSIKWPGMYKFHKKYHKSSPYDL